MCTSSMSSLQVGVWALIVNLQKLSFFIRSDFCDSRMEN